MSILGDLPAYTSFAVAADPGAPNTLKEDLRRAHFALHEKASLLAHEHGVSARSSVIEGREVQAILHFLKEENANLLVIGLHQHDFYLSRLWSSVYDLAQGAFLQRARRAFKHAGQGRRGVSVEMGLALGGFTA